MQKQKRANPLKNIGWYAAMLLYTAAVISVVSCQQPTKHTPKVTKQEKNAQKPSEQSSQSDKSNKPEKSKKNDSKDKDEKQNGENKNEQQTGEITYQGLEIPKTLSRTPEVLSERIVDQKEIGQSEAELNGYGVPEKYIEKEIRYDISAAFDDNLLLDPSHHSIYPGAILAGDSIDDGSYREITQGNKRKAVISFSLQGVKDKSGKAGITSGEIIPNLAAYRSLHNEILSQKITYHASAHSSYEEKDIKSEESFDVNFKVGVGFTAAGIKTKIGSGFKFKSGEHKSRHLIKFVETFYTVDVNQENRPLMTDIPREILGQRMPVYVSSVSYGRIAYLSIESDKDWDEIKPHLETVLKASPTTAEIEVSNAIKKLNQNTATTINIIGGSDEAVTNLAQFRKYIVKGGFSSGNPGQIIKYKLRFLDNNATAHIKYGGQYKTVERTKVIGKGIKVTAGVNKISCNITDFGEEGEVFGTIGMRPKHDIPNEQKIFDYDRESNPLIVPCKSSRDIPPQEKTITVPNSSVTVQLAFDIRERNYSWAGGDRFFVTDPEGVNNTPITRRVEDLKNRKTHTFTVYQTGKPREKIEFSIDFNVEYIF